MSHTVYLDHNATSPLKAEVKKAVIYAMEIEGNPSSVHGAGRKAKRLVEDAREQVRVAVNAPKSAQVIFTSCGTEANTLALNGVNPVRVLASATEHASVLGARSDIESIPVDAFGRVDLGHLQTMLAAGDGHALVSVMMANNETGVLQHIEDIAHLAHRFGALVHVDGIQALGKVNVDFLSLGIDMLSLSAHKIGGPLGVGALIASKDVKLQASNRGGGQGGGLRGGTENVSGISGFGVAAEIAKSELVGMQNVKALRDHLEAEIKAFAEDATVIADDVERLPNTSFISMAGVSAETQLMTMDLAGICVSAGSACSSGKSKSSLVLKAMGLGEDIAKTAIRVSLGHTNKKNDVDHFISAWKDLYQRQARKSQNNTAAV
ncbi:MAG: cysteine desulfurase [Magnetovibrio sp.]|nr:cysteine desulfurase [Magnetovibrio sp.]